jgi:hypothetical protein
LNFFNLLVQLSNTQNQFVRFAPQPFRPTLPYREYTEFVLVNIELISLILSFYLILQ